MKVLNGVVFIFIMSSLASCIFNKVQVELPGAKPGPEVVALTWNYLNPTVLSGEMIPFAFTNGAPAYLTNANGIGTFDSTTLEYTPPLNYAPTNHSITASDNEGKIGTNNIKIAGFQPGFKIKFPESFGDQNFPTSVVSTLNGDLYVSSIVSNTPGWEIWVTYKSTDYGQTWSKVDVYAPYEDGESHPLALASKGNDVYTCGYQWGFGGAYNSEWIVRKSSNAGVTWNTVDDYHDYLSGDHVCYDIAVDSGSGNIYTVGYDTDAIASRAVVRVSTDDGTTWSTIGSFSGVGNFVSVKVSPAGVIWAISSDGSVHQGTYALGVWNWVVTGNTIASSPGIYEMMGDLELVSETTAYFSGTNGGWKISKTTDGGVTWNTVYSGGIMTRGQDIKRLSSGELVAAGFFYPTPLHFVILRSTDNGATWNATYNDNTVSKKGITLIEAKDSSVIVVGEYNDSPYQIIVMRSTDAGASWSQRSEIYFKQNLWTDLYDLKIDGLGNLWSVGFMKYVDANFKNAWAVIKSSDNGVTWQDSDVFSLAGNHSTASSLAIGPSNEIYAAGTTSATRFSLRSSTDSGMTWSELDNYSVAGATQAFDDTRIAIATNGDVFYAGTSGWPQVVELRKGAVNGTVWSTPVTFPRPGSTDFTLTDMKAFSDGSLWISGLDRQISLYNVIYRSIDNGVTFTEVFREDWGLNEKQELKRLSNGDIYAISGMTIKKTSDNGTTWTLVHDGVTSRILGYTFDSLGRLYVHHNNSDVVVAQNQFNGSWFDVYQYSLLNKYNNRVIKLTNCGNMTQVCLIGYYENAIEGSILEMIPLVVP